MKKATWPISDKAVMQSRTLSWTLRSNYGNLYVWQWRPPLTARWHTCTTHCIIITHCTIKVHTDREEDQTSGRKGPIAVFCLCVSRNTFDWCYSTMDFDYAVPTFGDSCPAREDQSSLVAIPVWIFGLHSATWQQLGPQLWLWQVGILLGLGSLHFFV